MSPDAATEKPSSSNWAPSLAVSLAWVAFAQVPPVGSTNTYADPRAVFPATPSTGAPATIVSPDTATALPSSSPSLAVSLVCVAVAQVPPVGRTNTYADP